MRIVVATDGSAEAKVAAQTAAELVANSGSELHIVHVRPRIASHSPGYYVGPEVVEHAQHKEQEHLDREAQRLLDTQVEQVRAVGGSGAQGHLRIGRSAEEIVALAEELGVGLIVMGSRGLGGLKRALMGSVSDSVVHHAHCSVLVVRKEEREKK
jgi:nucleotide-binding universal stress UspA family protein